MTITREQDGPPRPVLPVVETTDWPGYDVEPRPFCRARAFDADGAPMPCQARAAMAWHGVPFCIRHAPRRVPGAGGWIKF